MERRKGIGSKVVGVVLATLAIAPSASAQTLTRETGALSREQAPERGVVDADVRSETPEPPEPQPAELMPRGPMARAAGWILRPDPEPSSREEQAEEALDRYFDDVLNEDRMSVVGANPWYHQVQRRLRREFQPDMGDLRDERQAPMNALGRLFDELGRYAPGPEPPQDVAGTPPLEIQSQFDDTERAMLEWQDQINLLNAPVTWYRVDLRVIQNPEGVVSAAWVIRSSGYDTLDQAALSAVRSGTDLLPPPPPSVVGDRDAIVSEWAFEAGDVATYINTAGCIDDPVRGGVQCAAGGRGIVRTRIRLLRVIDAERDSFEQRRFERRQEPPVLHDPPNG